MKKITTLCLVLVLTIVGAMQAQAQSCSYGITAGYNLTKMKFSGNWKESFSSDNKPGWFIGPKVAFNTPLGIGIDIKKESVLLRTNSFLYKGNSDLFSCSLCSCSLVDFLLLQLVSDRRSDEQS